MSGYLAEKRERERERKEEGGGGGEGGRRKIKVPWNFQHTVLSLICRDVLYLELKRTNELYRGVCFI